MGIMLCNYKNDVIIYEVVACYVQKIDNNLALGDYFDIT